MAYKASKKYLRSSISSDSTPFTADRVDSEPDPSALVVRASNLFSSSSKSFESLILSPGSVFDRSAAILIQLDNQHDQLSCNVEDDLAGTRAHVCVPSTNTITQRNSTSQYFYLSGNLTQSFVFKQREWCAFTPMMFNQYQHAGLDD